MRPKSEQTALRGNRAAPTLLLTKLHPPPAREQTIDRARLIEHLRPRPGVRVAVIAAPAGCGKTTLLSAWRDAEATRRPVAWVTLDEGDNDPIVLWAHVLESLRRVCPSLSTPPLRTAREITEVVLPQLVNELTEQGDVALILDDFHRLTDGPARDTVRWFVERTPPSCLVLLATRSEPALRLGALRAHGDLIEVRAADLSFTSDEAAVLLNERLELGLERDDVDELVARTEGWPAGLYLAALSLGAVDDRAAFVDRFGGSSRHVVDFMVDEVLHAHDPTMQSLMLRASVLDRICEPLCDYVLEEHGTGERLRSLARTNLFLVPLDDRGEWFRFHHLFGQLLRVELEHREPGAAAELHRRAFAWHRDHGSVDSAIDHALEAGLFAEAGELIAAVWVDYVKACRFATVSAWIARFPPDILRNDAKLLLAAAWVRSLGEGRAAGAEMIAALEALGPLDAGALPDGFSSAEASLATLRATIPWGDYGGALVSALRAAELEGPSSPWRAVVCSALGMILFFDGDLDEADRWFAEAAALAPASEHWVIASSSRAYRSRIAGLQGRHDDQNTLVDESTRIAREHTLDFLEHESLIALGEALVARGQAEDALPHFDRAISFARPQGFHGVLADALLCQASALQTLGRTAAADASIREAAHAVAACPDPRTLADRLEELRRPPRAARRALEGPLSSRELVILGMLRGPLTERDIGRELYLSHNTIHSHTRSIYRKLGVTSRGEALRRGRELGLV